MATHCSVLAWRVTWTEEPGGLHSIGLQRIGHNWACEELAHWKRLWCWERLGAGGEGDDRGCDGWMASPTRWTWVWVSSGSWLWTGRPGMLRFMGSQSWTWLSDWTELNWACMQLFLAPYCFFAFCCSRNDVSRWKHCSRVPSPSLSQLWQAKEFEKCPETGRNKEGLSPRTYGGNVPADTLILDI